MSEATEDNKTVPTFAVFTNNEDKRPLNTLMWGFYSGVMQNRVGIMEALDSETNEPTLILFGLQSTEDGEVECFPLATVLANRDAARFKSPDGEGGWIEPRDVEKAEGDSTH